MSTKKIVWARATKEEIEQKVAELKEAGVKTKSEFFKACQPAYQKARQYGILNDLFGNQKRGPKKGKRNIEQTEKTVDEVVAQLHSEETQSTEQVPQEEKLQVIV